MIKSRLRTVFPIIIIAAATLYGCLFGNSSEAGVGDLGEEIRTQEYTVSGNRIIIRASIDTARYCSGDTLRTEAYPTGPDTIEFRISGRVLWIENGGQVKSGTGWVVRWAWIALSIPATRPATPHSPVITNRKRAPLLYPRGTASSDPPT